MTDDEEFELMLGLAVRGWALLCASISSVGRESSSGIAGVGRIIRDAETMETYLSTVPPSQGRVES